MANPAHVLSFLRIASSVFETSLSMLWSSSGMNTALPSEHIRQPVSLALREAHYLQSHRELSPQGGVVDHKSLRSWTALLVLVQFCR